MEEDIKFIKYYMKQYFYEDISIKDDFKFEEAVKNLLDRYKQLEEDNNKLSKMLCLCTPEVPQNNHDKYISYVDIVKKLVDSIPKSKVKEKIEELKQKAISYGTFIDKDESFNIQSKISVLQDLLERSGEDANI